MLLANHVMSYFLDYLQQLRMDTFDTFILIEKDASPSVSRGVLSNTVFGVAGDPVTLVSQYKACSHGQLVFVPLTSSKQIQGKMIDDGAITITVSNKVKDGAETLMNAAVRILTQNDIFSDHMMFVMPEKAMNGIAYAGYNSYYSVYVSLHKFFLISILIFTMTINNSIGS